MRPMKRAMHFDFHTMPGISGLFSGFSAEDFAEKLAENNVSYINFTCRCNIGFSYYDTKVGIKYPGLDRDMLKEVLDACHKRGIGVSAYVNAGLDHEMALRRPEFCRIDRNGRVYGDNRVYDNFFRTMCYNSGYGEHLMNEVLELAAYDVDGIMCDCMVTRECYCPRCMEKMLAEGVDTSSPEAVFDYQRRLIVDFCRRVRENVKKDVHFTFKNVEWREELQTQAELVCLPTTREWGYDLFTQQASYVTTRYHDLVYMSGRFQSDWGDFGGIKPVAAFQNDMYDALLNGFELSFGDHLHPVDGLSSTVIERVGKVFTEMKAYEPYTENARKIADVGVLVPRNPDFATNRMAGISRMLNEIKLPFLVYDEEGAFEKAKLLIIPGALPLSDALKERLATYHKNGGKLLILGDAIPGTADLPFMNGVEYIGLDDSDNAYFTFAGESERWAMYAPSVKIKNRTGKELARYVNRVFNHVYDGKHGYFYCPQGTVSDMSAAVVGDGVGVICFDAFAAYGDTFLYEIKRLVSEAITLLLSENELLFTTCGFDAATVISVTENDRHRILHVKATRPEIRNGRGIIEEHTRIFGGEISLAGEYKVTAIPEEKPVTAKVENGRTEISTGEICGYRAYLLEKA